MENEPDPILKQLSELNEELAKQRSFKRHLLNGLFYGIGFVIGSAVLATIIIGFAAPYVASLPFVQQFFERGASVIGG